MDVLVGHVRDGRGLEAARGIGIVWLMQDGGKIIHACQRMRLALDEADVVALAAVQIHHPQFRLGPMHTIRALRIAHGPPPAGCLPRFELRFDHAEIPCAELVAVLDHRAVKYRAPMIQRTFRATAQHGIRGMFRRRDERDFQVLLPRDAVVIEGEADLFARV